MLALKGVACFRLLGRLKERLKCPLFKKVIIIENIQRIFWNTSNFYLDSPPFVFVTGGSSPRWTIKIYPKFDRNVPERVQPVFKDAVDDGRIGYRVA